MTGSVILITSSETMRMLVMEPPSHPNRETAGETPTTHALRRLYGFEGVRAGLNAGRDMRRTLRVMQTKMWRNLRVMQIKMRRTLRLMQTNMWRTLHRHAD